MRQLEVYKDDNNFTKRKNTSNLISIQHWCRPKTHSTAKNSMIIDITTTVTTPYLGQWITLLDRGKLALYWRLNVFVKEIAWRCQYRCQRSVIQGSRSSVYIYSTATPQTGFETRLMFKRSKAGFNSKFFFS